jgi:hypothetical protein
VPTPPAPPREPLDLVLHIGSSKTGSSSIQNFLHDNREHLADLGYLYPLTGGTWRHSDLARVIMSDADLAPLLSQRQGQSEPATVRKKFRRQLIREIDQSGLSRVLLSNEILYRRPDAASLRRLRRLTDKIATSLRLVVYLRRQDDHMISRYQQMIWNGTEIRRLDEYAQQDTSFPYNYAARLRTWKRLLEPDEFIVRRFERNSFVSGSLVQDFLDAAGVDVQVADLEQVPRLNESLDAESLEFLRLFNLYLVESEGATLGLIDDRFRVARRALTSFVVQNNKNRQVAARFRDAPTGPVLTLPGPVLDAFMKQWEASNQRVARQFLGDKSGQLFHLPRKTSNTTTEQQVDPARVDHFLTLLELPEQMHTPMRALAEREAKSWRT